jgi:hypothetical protein
MNDLERRLHHAARELRSIDIEPPPLATISAPSRPTGLAGRVPALVMPVLFVLGGLAVIAGGLGRTAEPPDALPAAAVEHDVGQGVGQGVELRVAADPPDPTESAAIAASLTVHQELALIASLAPTATPGHDVLPTPTASAARTLARQYR